MATPYETFVNRELPRRPVMLTVDLTGYDGDPNSLSAPSIVQDAPKGTFYLRDSTGVLYQKGYNDPGTYRVVGGSGPVPGLDRFYNRALIGIKDGVNTIFLTPDNFIADTECIYKGGMRLFRGIDSDYVIAEGGGVGSGYNTVIFSEPPIEEDALLCDYSIIDPVKLRFGIELLGVKDGVNTTFTTPEVFIANTECIYWNGARLTKGIGFDYTIEESGGPGAGYDTIVLSVAPILGEALKADYSFS